MGKREFEGRVKAHERDGAARHDEVHGVYIVPSYFFRGGGVEEEKIGASLAFDSFARNRGTAGLESRPVNGLETIPPSSDQHTYGREDFGPVATRKIERIWISAPPPTRGGNPREERLFLWNNVNLAIQDARKSQRRVLPG